MSTAVATPSEWSCTYCTFDNPVTVKICQICAKTRVKPVARKTVWNCGMCTFENKLDTNICGMCGTQKPKHKPIEIQPTGLANFSRIEHLDFLKSQMQVFTPPKKKEEEKKAEKEKKVEEEEEEEEEGAGYVVERDDSDDDSYGYMKLA